MLNNIILLIYCLCTRGKNISFASGNRLLISHLCFDSKLFITFLVGLFLKAVGRKHIFLLGRFIACIDTYLHAKFKNNLSGGSV